MECNKEEAEKCKAISEVNFKRHDLVGAKKYALKARQLFPELEGLSQLFSILEVHIAARQKLRSGESNCYGILQVDFRADDNTIRKQYRKLALVLHPDKNKAFGAEAAFKHISEAWSVLSDRDKKLGFDKRWREYMAARATHPSYGACQTGDTFRSSRVPVSTVNISKTPNVNYTQQHQAHAFPQQGANVHRQQEQFRACVFQQQRYGAAHVHLQQQQGHTNAHQQQRQEQEDVPRQQWHGQANAPLQQGQGQGQLHSAPLQGQAHAPQQQDQEKACGPEQQRPSQGHVHPQQGQSQSFAQQGHWQGQVHGHEQEGQGEVHVPHQQEQGQVHVPHQQGQGAVHTHQQQGEDTIQAQGQAHQVPVPQKHHAHHVHQVQGQQDPVHTHRKKGQEGTHVQGRAYQAPVPQSHHDEHNQAHTNKPSQPAFQHSKPTFWTACPSCRMQLEYERAHVNKNLCCPMCYKAFVSKEISPVQGSVLWPPPISQPKPGIKTDAGIKGGSLNNNFDRIPRGDFSLPSMVHSNKKAKMDTEDNPLRQHGDQKLQEAPAPPPQKPVEVQEKGLGRSGKDELRKRVAMHAKEGLERLIARSRSVIAQKLSEEKERNAAAEDKVSAIEKNKKGDNGRSTLASGLFVQNKPVAAGKDGYVHIMKEKANVAVACNSRGRTRNSTKLHREVRKVPGFVKGVSVPKVEALQRKRKLASPMDRSIEDRNKGVLDCNKESKSYQNSEDREVSSKCPYQVDGIDESTDKCRMEVPDPDFHNFDGDRTEDQFASGQIWASYDDDDGMPRYYGRVNKILSRQPLKMQMNWLEAHSPSDETLAWLNSGFQHSCGNFKLGSMYIAEEVSTFSHLMAVDKGLKGGFKIYPRQGDVWAIYKDWEVLKVKEDKRGYNMVEIVAAFDEEKGVQVSPLLKVAGFKTIFEIKPGEDHMKWIPPQELRRLSHQVPAHRMMAGETPRIQVDCLELDPASTPMNLIYGNH